MSLGHVLLGVLAEGPAHGYDLKGAHDERFPGAKTLAYAQVYARWAGSSVMASSRWPKRRKVVVRSARRTPSPILVENRCWRGCKVLRRQREVHLSRMRELLALQRQTMEVDARIAVDHTISHLDADLRRLETAAARVAAEGKNQSPLAALS